ncbi:UNVERIFIED_CONTAM: Beta-glucosidase 12, partial [Sesamum radiatum]
MAATMSSILTTFMLLLVSSSLVRTGHGLSYGHFNRSVFPTGFLFGAASSAYQYEGAAFEGGRGQSIWDTYTHKYADKISDGSNGDVANNFYNLYKEDVKLMKDIGLDAFRMSISWPRILPHGKLSGGVNKEGIAFYNNVFNELLANGITPFVTLFHWDLPQALDDEYAGFLSPRVVDDFKDFAELCFNEFGDRIKHWITMNEPFTFSNGGYDGGFIGNLALGGAPPGAFVPKGIQLLSPISSLIIYFLATQLLPEYTRRNISKLDVQAAQRALDFIYGWFIDPLVHGEYPRIMQSLVGNRLPKFTKEQSAMLKGSFDFLGLNYYTGNYAAHILSYSGNISSTTDKRVRLSTDINGVHIGKPTGVSIFFDYPRGLHDLLVYTKERYNNPTIYITENGMGDVNNHTTKHATEDIQRVNFYNGHLRAVQKAI